MRKFLFLATTFCFGVGLNFSLQAAQTATAPTQTTPSSAKVSSSKSTTTSSTSTTSTTTSPATSTKESQATSTTSKETEEDESQMAAWMIETAKVANDYVDGLDKEKYAESWSKGDQLFQNTISQDEWTRALSASRKGLGKVKSRTLKLHRPAWNPRGLPRGPYMVVEYDTSFDNAPESGELLTMRRGSDGKWRVLTYQVN